ncbi:MAG: hypothetical protein KJ000_24345 [Pirellulaceae bacterium]|nr:hypothetical protein [Pirellulaceae bacterium]
MLRKLFERFFRRQRLAAKPEPQGLAYPVDLTLPHDPLPAQMMACVLRNGELMAVSRDAAPRLQDGEVCWLLPADDVTVPVVLHLDDSPLAVELTVRFETDPTIAVLLRDRQTLTREEIVALLDSELDGLFDLLGQSPPALLELDDEGRERLRAKLSLMLQAKGLRCTALGAFQLAAKVEKPEQPAAEERKVIAGGLEEEGEPDVIRAALEPVLTAAIERVQDNDQWEELLEQIEAGGMPLDDSVADELDSLGQSVVQREIDATQAARRVSELAEAARRDAGVVQPDLRHWQGLALRMRLMDQAEVERNSFRSEPEQAASDRNEFRSTRSRRPWTWWMLRRSAVDQRLREFLQNVMRRTRASLDARRSSLQQISTAGSLKELSDRFGVVEDLLETVPTLVPRQRQYRLDRQQQKQAVQNIQRAVTAAELAQAAVHALSTQPENNAAWQTALTEATRAIQALEEHLRARRQVRK